MFVVVWEFTILPDHRAEFERAYGPGGDWARLFRRAPGYVETVLLHDTDRPDVYLTIDRWRTPNDFTAGMASLGPDYHALDEACSRLTVKERKLGGYTEV